MWDRNAVAGRATAKTKTYRLQSAIAGRDAKRSVVAGAGAIAPRFAYTISVAG